MRQRSWCGFHSPCPRCLRGEESSKRTQFGGVASWRCQVSSELRNKPNSPDRGSLDADTVRDDPSRQTKPIAGPRGDFHADTPKRTDRAKQTQFPPDRGWAVSLTTGELRWNVSKGTAPNKANFMDQGPLPCRHGRGRPIAPNEANFVTRGGLSQVPRRSYEGIVSRLAVQNKAGIPWAEGSFRADTSRDGPPCETKPISPGPAKACLEPGEGTRDQGDERGRSSYAGGRANAKFQYGWMEGANRVAASRPKALAMVVRTGNSPSPILRQAQEGRCEDSA